MKKICKYCKEEKLLAEFYKDSHHSLGVTNKCKVCTILLHKKRYKENDRVKKSAKISNKKSYIKLKDKIKERRRDRYKKDPEYRAKEQRRIYLWNQKEENKIKTRLWKENNKEKLRYSYKVQSSIRRARFHKAGRLRNRDIKALIEWNHSFFMEPDLYCEYCSNLIDGPWHLEHIHPLSKGGSNKLENLAIACFNCNSRKAAKLLDEFYFGKSFYFRSRNFYRELESLREGVLIKGH